MGMTVKTVKEVKIGQVYRDNDPRLKGRRKVEVLSVKGKTASARNIVTGHETKISVSRLLDTGSHGYTYVKSKRGRKPSGRLDLESVTMKVSKKAHRVMTAQAKRHANGNISAWLRHTGVNYKMKKGEIVVLDAA
jgi:hypothetical protein